MAPYFFYFFSVSISQNIGSKSMVQCHKNHWICLNWIIMSCCQTSNPAISALCTLAANSTLTTHIRFLRSHSEHDSECTVTAVLGLPLRSAQTIRISLRVSPINGMVTLRVTIVIIVMWTHALPLTSSALNKTNKAQYSCQSLHMETCKVFNNIYTGIFQFVLHT